MHSYFHKVCLIQVTMGDTHWVIDPLALRTSDLEPLWAVLSDPAVPILMHGADYDIRILDRDYGASVRGLEDTQIMAQLLGEPKTGLAALLDKELEVRLDKRHQRADWGRRPLTTSQLAYAAADTAFLDSLTTRLRARLESLGRWGWAEEEFRKLESVRHVEPEPDPRAFERIKGARSLRGAARDRLFTLHTWREQQARSMDVPPFKVLGNEPLKQMAETVPHDLEGLSEVSGVGHRAVRRWGRELLAAIRDPKPAPPPAAKPCTPGPNLVAQRRIKALQKVRDERAAALGLSGGLLCPRGCLEQVADSAPRKPSPQDLARAGLSGWRLEVLGEGFAEALAER